MTSRTDFTDRHRGRYTQGGRGREEPSDADRQRHREQPRSSPGRADDEDGRRRRADGDGRAEAHRSRPRSRSRSPRYSARPRRSRSPPQDSRPTRADRRRSPPLSPPATRHPPPSSRPAADLPRHQHPSRSISPASSRPTSLPIRHSRPQDMAYNTRPNTQVSQARPGGHLADVRAKSESPEPATKDEPNFAVSGKLAAETKTYKGVVLKYHEPAEARKPTKHWRLYVFKQAEQLDMFHIHHQSAYLFGRDRVVADIPIDHPSSSKQHAVIQFRQSSTTDHLGQSKTTVKPFIIDLESANGTFVNQEKIPESRYFELQSGDSEAHLSPDFPLFACAGSLILWSHLLRAWGSLT